MNIYDSFLQLRENILKSKTILQVTIATPITFLIWFHAPQHANASDDICTPGWQAGDWKVEYEIKNETNFQFLGVDYTNLPTGIKFSVNTVKENGKLSRVISINNFDKMIARDDLYKILLEHQPYVKHKTKIFDPWEYDYYSNAGLRVLFHDVDTDWKAMFSGNIEMSYSSHENTKKYIKGKLQKIKPYKSSVEKKWSLSGYRRNADLALKYFASGQYDNIKITSYLKPEGKKAIPLRVASMRTHGLVKLSKDLQSHLDSFKAPNAVLPCPK